MKVTYSTDNKSKTNYPRLRSDRLQCISLTHDADLDLWTLTFNPQWDMIMSYSHAKGQGQRSVCSKDREYTNGWMDGQMDGGECITWLVNHAVGNKLVNCWTTYRLLAEDHLFDSDDLQDVVGTRLKLTRSHTLVDTRQQFSVDIVTVVNTYMSPSSDTNDKCPLLRWLLREW